MKKKDTPFLDFYKECMKTGEMTERKGSPTDGGLCSSVIGTRDELELFEPTFENEMEYMVRADEHWGYGYHGYLFDRSSRFTSFTPLRQTIVLFCAAINNEL